MAELKRAYASDEPLEIESLDHEGRGVARREGKVVFVDGALPGEAVRASVYRRKPSFELAQATAILRPSSSRVAPACPHFGVCGGCSLQHLDPFAQVAIKQRVLEDNLAHIGGVRAETILAPIAGPAWGYRLRARFSVRNVVRKGGVLVGFHERKSSYIADMRECHVVPSRISALLVPLRALVGALSIPDRMPQVELACGDDADALVFRILQPLTDADERLLREFGDAHRVQIWLQPVGPETAHPFHPADATLLSYRLPEFGVALSFSPTEFTQVNLAVNRVLVRRALSLLDPQPGERIADFFCGLGNFSLPIARRGAAVTGVEGSRSLVERARDNAQRNGLGDAARFVEADLFRATPESLARLGPFDRVLIDPPRDGAMELVKSLPAQWPRRIVYVSCSPSTLARDAGVLVNTQGFVLKAAGVVNMFPHTSHVESIGLFERPAP